MGNTAAEAIAPLPAAELAIAEAAFAAVVAAELVLPGPALAVDVEPPATKPALPLAEPAPVRM
jgi:hypothetical protein